MSDVLKKNLTYRVYFGYYRPSICLRNVFTFFVADIYPSRYSVYPAGAPLCRVLGLSGDGFVAVRHAGLAVAREKGAAAERAGRWKYHLL